MKKLLLILLSLLLLASCTKGSDTDGNTEFPTLSVEEKYAEAVSLIDSNSYTKAYEILKEIEDYSEAASLLENFLVVEKKTMTRQDGSTYTFETTTNSKGIVVCEREVEFDSSYTIWEYFLDDEGIVTTMKMNDDGYISTWEYTYDENDNPIKLDGVDEDGNKGYYTYEYDEKGNCIKEIYSDASAPITTTYTYDENSNLICENCDWGYGLYSLMEYEYDDDNLKIRTSYSDQDSSWYSVNTYDENGNISVNILTEGDNNEITTFTYYPDGKVESATILFSNGEETKTEYTYETNVIYRIN